METTQVKTEEAVRHRAKRNRPSLRCPKEEKWLKRLIIAVVVLAAIFLIFIRPMMSAGQQFVAGTYLPETAQRQGPEDSPCPAPGPSRPSTPYRSPPWSTGEIVRLPLREGDWVEKGALPLPF